MVFWQRVEQWIATLERSAIVVSFAALLGLGLLQILLRNVFASGLFGVDELLRHWVLWLGFLGASLATREQRHLRIDILSRVLPAPYQPWLDCGVNLFALVGCALLAQSAWAFVRGEFITGTTLTVGIAAWIAQGIIPLSFGLMTCRFAIHFINACIQLSRK